MYLSKILILVAVGLICTNARVLKKKIRGPIAAPSCGSPLSILEPTYGCFGTCGCQQFLDELSCGCQYTETYGVLSPELPNYGRVSVIKLPIGSCEPGMRVGSFDAAILPAVNCDAVLPAINLPGTCEVLPQAMPCVSELPCLCQAPLAYQFVETCGCRMQNPILPSQIISIPSESCTRAPKCLPQVMRLPSCGCQNMPCSCPSMPCSCQNMPCDCLNMPCNNCQTLPCSCQNVVCGCQTMPCSCQTMPCSCQTMPCTCQTMPCSCQTMPCSCQTMPCGCQNIPCASQIMPCGCQNSNCQCQSVYLSQLPALEMPCPCQACQLSPVELPVYGCGCQSLPPPVIGCGGKYLRQVTIPPPFL